MLPRRPSLAPRRILTVLATCAALVLTGCAGTEIEEPTEGSESRSQSTTDRPDAASGTASAAKDIECTPAPELPSDVPTFRATQAPTATVPDVASLEVGTNCGTVTVELDGAAAPQTVASFLLLAEGDFWVDSPCHRLVDANIHVLQCGDPTGTGRGGPGYMFGIENAPSDGMYPRGTIAMARSEDPDSNGSQFFIVFDDTMLPTNGGGYTIFGKVTGGMDIVDHIADEGVEGGGVEGMPAQPISILDVEIEEEAAST